MAYLKTLICILYLFLGPLLYAAPMFVFKTSAHPPEVVFQRGLISPGDNENFIQHISGRLCFNDQDGFVSTMAYWQYVQLVVLNILHHAYATGGAPSTVYVYTIRATNNFYSSEITLDHLANLNPSPIASMIEFQLARAAAIRSTEYITPAQIAPELIQEVHIFTIETDGELVETHQYNRGYIPDATEANTGPYLGSDTLAPQNISMPLVAGIPPVTACLLPDEGSGEHFEPFLLYVLNNLLE